MMSEISKIVEMVLPDVIEVYALDTTVQIYIEPLADEETLESLFAEDPYELLGIYSGMAQALDLHEADLTRPIEIWLFEDAIRRKLI
jgi:predicted Zn-dependent protease with MMP-like domain